MTAIATAATTFAELLANRLNLQVHTTEDGVRYTFFAALLSAGFSPHQMALEFPHAAIKGAEIDTVILDESGQPEAAIEFKYHRDIPSGATAPRTMKAGQIFKDLVRLSGISGKCKLYFVYVTDSTMANYFRNQPKPLSEFFDLAEGDRLEIVAESLAKMAKTFHTHMGNWPGPIRFAGLLRRELPKGHHLRVYKVELPEAQS